MPAPVITSSLTALTVAGESFTYSITASNTPTSYNATGLPTGLSVNTSTGAITGTVTALREVYSVTVSATNGSGTGTATLQLTVVASYPSDADQSASVHELQAEGEPRLLAKIYKNGIPVSATVASQPTTARTPTITRVTSSGASPVVAGARSVTFVFSTDFVGTILAVAYTGAIQSITLTAPGNDTLAAIAYTVTAGSMDIIKLV